MFELTRVAEAQSGLHPTKDQTTGKTKIHNGSKSSRPRLCVLKHHPVFICQVMTMLLQSILRHLLPTECEPAFDAGTP